MSVDQLTVYIHYHWDGLDIVVLQMNYLCILETCYIVYLPKNISIDLLRTFGISWTLPSILFYFTKGVLFVNI